MVQHETIARVLADFAPPGWQKAWLSASVNDGHVGDITTDYIDAAGAENWFDIDDTGKILDVSQALVELRTSMKQEGHAPWSSCVFTLFPQGNFKLDVQYKD